MGVVVELEILDGCAVHFRGLTCSDPVAAVDRTEVYSGRVVERNIKLNADLARGFKRNERYGFNGRRKPIDVVVEIQALPLWEGVVDRAAEQNPKAEMASCLFLSQLGMTAFVIKQQVVCNR